MNKIYIVILALVLIQGSQTNTAALPVPKNTMYGSTGMNILENPVSQFETLTVWELSQIFGTQHMAAAQKSNSSALAQLAVAMPDTLPEVAMSNTISATGPVKSPVSTPTVFAALFEATANATSRTTSALAGVSAAAVNNGSTSLPGFAVGTAVRSLLHSATESTLAASSAAPMDMGSMPNSLAHGVSAFGASSSSTGNSDPAMVQNETTAKKKIFPPFPAINLQEEEFSLDFKDAKSDSEDEMQAGVETANATAAAANPFMCALCFKCFAQAQNLERHHNTVHLGQREYECTECGKKFKQQGHLKSHEVTHTGAKPYQCRYPNCSKAYGYIHGRKKHEATHAK